MIVVDTNGLMELLRKTRRQGRSMAEKVREILRYAAVDEGRTKARLGSRIAERFAGLGFDEEIPEMHGQNARLGRGSGPRRPLHLGTDNAGPQFTI